ncbi:MAG: Rieske 2Fe-2S domain-containing protein [Chloroflexota bacterium]|nr:Rieske 2Fe-2S domain-containing protein [Candidatus Limnocylindria bacterium]
MIRPHDDTSIVSGGMLSRVKRRQLLRIGFLTGALLAVTELTAAFLPFFRVIKIEGLGAKIAAGNKADILARFQATQDEPILNQQGRFFLIHAPGAIAAAYVKCTHLGCTVPYTKSEGQFHCPCHGSLYDKTTALVTGGPAPRGLDLFHVSETATGSIVVDTNPLNVLQRPDNQWNPAHVQVPDA